MLSTDLMAVGTLQNTGSRKRTVVAPVNRCQINDRPRNPHTQLRGLQPALVMGVWSPRNVSARAISSRVAVEHQGLYKGFCECSSSHHPPIFTSSLQSFRSSLRFHSTVCFQSLQTAPRAFVTKPISNFPLNTYSHFNNNKPSWLPSLALLSPSPLPA